ncbi:retropepsin-like aspartic protease [Spectribacter hydrogenoxidans]|uniref:Retropepsin-like aspartic protease n=1 Tax=Spectribacter hydrogenoxidans TaxID=3075608 RepID=A0ABU3C222_9GAMM|nr:retropepsin-like aspartic protease [Salinisphaera sp. W335]MDT0635610.1 retropepsin-like aspartic protease [Salinisphaera sp. W335]
MFSYKCHALALIIPLLVAGTAVAAERFSHTASMQQVDSGNYYVHADFGNGVGAEFLVDTGSGYVALSRDTFKRLEGDTSIEYLRRITGRMANGELVTVPVYRVASLRLGGGCLLTDVEVTVMPGSKRNILGLSALRKAEPFAMQLSPPKLLLSNCVVEPIT